MWEYAGPAFTIASFVLTAVGMLVAVTRSLSNMEIQLRIAINKSKDEVEQKIAEMQREVEAKQQSTAREFAETVRALKEHVHKIETWARDEFVRKGSFENSLGRLENTVGDQFAQLGQRLERMEAKIDSKT